MHNMPCSLDDRRPSCVPLIQQVLLIQYNMRMVQHMLMLTDEPLETNPGNPHATTRHSS